MVMICRALARITLSSEFMMQYRHANPHCSFLSLFQRDLQQGKLGTNELGYTVFFVDEDDHALVISSIFHLEARLFIV
jgi:hypothetical protein